MRQPRAGEEDMSRVIMVDRRQQRARLKPGRKVEFATDSAGVDCLVEPATCLYRAPGELADAAHLIDDASRCALGEQNLPGAMFGLCWT